MFLEASYLKKGDTIGITCPAGAIDISVVEHMVNQLKAWGFVVVVGKTIGTRFHTYSASDEDRLNDLQAMIDNPEIKAIYFGRGGYGVVRIIDQINFDALKKNPKWLIGYSDITCIHSHIHSNYHCMSIHAHMSGGYLPAEQDLYATQSIYDMLFGKKVEYSIASHFLNRNGKAEGILCGGNLALLSDLIGTKSDIDTKGKILFIEDIGEYLYNIDRMMWQLKRADKLSTLAGLLVGGFTDIKDNTISFGMQVYDIVYEKVKEYTYPICFAFPVGHQKLNYALKCGANYQLDVQEEQVLLREILQRGEL